MRSVHNYARHGNEVEVKRLLEAGTDVNLKDDLFHHTPLHLAAETGQVKIVNLLLDYDADIYVEDDSHFTPLFIAVSSTEQTQDPEEREKCYRVIELLLRKEAELRSKGEYRGSQWLRDRAKDSSSIEGSSGITPFEFIKDNKEIATRFLEIEAKIKQEYPNYLAISTSENSTARDSLLPSAEVTKTLRQRKSSHVNREMTGDKSSEERPTLSRVNSISRKDKPVSAPFYGAFFQKLSNYFSAVKSSKSGKNLEEQDPLISKPPH